MQIIDDEEFLWSSKFRPQIIDDCILPKNLKDLFKNIVRQGETQNLLFSSGPGMGKSTVARALCNEMDLDYLFINASDENGVDILRSKIKQFASTVSITDEDSHKVVILDEADYLTPNSQSILRQMMEEYSKNCRFFFTCNFKNRIITPLHSRCTVIDLNTSDFKTPDVLKQLMNRLAFILKNENVEYEKNVLAEIITKWAPDFRRIINEIQKYSINSGGQLDSGILVSGGSVNADIRALTKFLKEKNFKEMRQWASDHFDIDTAIIFRQLYDGAKDFMKPESIPHLVIILGEYGYRDAFMTDKEINMAAAFTEIMMKCQFV